MDHGHGPAAARMSGPVRVRLLSGPPFGAELFGKVAARLEERLAPSQGAVSCEDVLDSAGGGGWCEAGDALARTLDADTVLVAHGLAVPAAVHAAMQVAPRRLVLTNGPTTWLHPVVRAVAEGARAGGIVFAETALRPAPWLGWLASSVCLRRAVVNPYVMDRDTVAALCGPQVATSAGRRALAAYLGSLAGGLPDTRSLRVPLLLVWGDDDRLHPAREATALEATVSGARHVAIPGGHWGHPEERPWALADAIAAGLAGD